MAESVVAFVVESLGNLLIQEATFLLGVKEQVEQMKTELKLMQSFLKNADRRQHEDERIHVCVSEIREAAYNAEDVIETFALKIASRRRGGIRNAFKRYACIIDEAAKLHRVGSEIEAIKSRISNLRASLQTYGITAQSEGEGSSSAHGTQQQWRQSAYSHVVEEYTVGLDGDVEILVTQLVNEKHHPGVVSICGMGGLGKTTLAKRIYHHNVIRRYFVGFAWVSISQQFQRRDVWEGILFSLISKEQREGIIKLRDDELAEKLYQVLQEKKCLVVLDDIWRPNSWDSLSPAFPIGKANSKLLLTTRNKEVALHVDPRGFLHEPRCLTEEESWELLQKKAFPRKDEPGFTINIAMEELGRKMAGRCAGLPLAIILLGGILVKKDTLNQWDIVHENIKLYLRTGKGYDQQQSGVSQVLALSYYELPYQLKPCFLHLSNFPEDFDIPTKKLVRIWMAEGLVSPILDGEGTIEDVAECYIGELLDRCMVQVGLRGSTGRIKTIRLHDLMRDLCLSKANEENFLKVIQNTQDGNERMVSSSTENISKSSLQLHRLAVHFGEKSDGILSWEHERSPYLRSLLIYWRYDIDYMLKRTNSWFTDFKLLKVLDIMNCNVEEKLLNAIGNFIHLRYLSIYYTSASDVPSSFGNLRCLQTLILFPGVQQDVISVPNVIWGMERLRHLYFPPNYGKNGDKLRLGNLSNLQTLCGFDTWSCDVKDLIKLTNLKKLRIHFRSNKELEEILRSASVTLSHLRSFLCSVDSIVEEIDLQRLLLACPRLYKLNLRGLIVKLPEYHHFPPNLTKLTLVWSGLEEDPMATLEKLPNLSTLHLLDGAFRGKEMVCSSKGFPQLKFLRLSHLRNLEEWCVAEEAMPSLCELRIEDCKKLKMVPDRLRFITTLGSLLTFDNWRS